MEEEIPDWINFLNNTDERSIYDGLYFRINPPESAIDTEVRVFYVLQDLD